MIRDNYSTPPWCYEALKPFIKWDKIYTFLEPCCGDNRITKWVLGNGSLIIAVSNDIQKTGSDSLLAEWAEYDLIITNPPYSRAEAFCYKFIPIATCCIFLLRLGFLASKYRKPLFARHPLTGLYVLSKRPSFDGVGTDNSEYAWFVWDKGNIAKTGIHHI